MAAGSVTAYTPATWRDLARSLSVGYGTDVVLLTKPGVGAEPAMAELRRTARYPYDRHEQKEAAVETELVTRFLAAVWFWDRQPPKATGSDADIATILTAGP